MAKGESSALREAPPPACVRPGLPSRFSSSLLGEKTGGTPHDDTQEDPMGVLKSEDNCLHCTHCKIWKSNYTKADCDLNKKAKGFHPDERVPRECVGKLYKR
jgi:hypothetical protein